MHHESMSDLIRNNHPLSPSRTLSALSAVDKVCQKGVRLYQAVDQALRCRIYQVGEMLDPNYRRSC